MEKKFAKGSSEWMMFMDFWTLCQKYWEPEESDSYWEDLIEATDDFYKKYNTEFAKALALTLVNEVERKNHICKRSVCVKN